MIYEKGMVIEKKGIIFKDDFTPDPKGSRPAMITIAVSEDNQYMYFLTLTSQVDKYFERPDGREQYQLVKKTPENGLKSNSLVNLANIYRDSVSQNKMVAYIQPDEYKKLIRKFKEYQEKNPDELYEEIKGLL